MFPQVRPYPQLLVSPAHSEEEESTGLVTETESNVINNNIAEASLDESTICTDSDKPWTNQSGDEKAWRSLEDGSSRKSSMSSLSVNLPHAKSIKVPSFESKMAKLSPVPLALSSLSRRHGGSALSVVSSLSSRSAL